MKNIFKMFNMYLTGIIIKKKKKHSCSVLKTSSVINSLIQNIHIISYTMLPVGQILHYGNII